METPTVPTPNQNPQTKFDLRTFLATKGRQIGLILAAFFIVVLIGSFFVFGSKIGLLPTKEVSNPTFNIPKFNKMAYLRCKGETGKFTSCDLYIAHLGHQDEPEIKVHTFNFPDIKDGNSRYSNIELKGIVDNKVIYAFSLRDQDIENDKFGYIDLNTGKDVEIYAYDVSNLNRYASSIDYLDTQNKKIYYRLHSGTETEPISTLYQYDLTNGQIKKIVDYKVTLGMYDDDIQAIYADSKNIYLSKGESVSWAETYNLETGAVTVKPEDIGPATDFSSSGKIAYTTSERNGSIYTLSLFLSDIDGKNKIKLYSFLSPILSHGPQGWISAVSFSPDGTKLVAKIDEGNGTTGENYKFWDIYDVTNENVPERFRPKGDGGIFIVPGSKTLPKYTDLILPYADYAEQAFEWVETSHGEDGSFRTGQNMIYRQIQFDDKTWYFSGGVLDDLVDNYGDGKADITKTYMTPIVLGANDLVISPE